MPETNAKPETNAAVSSDIGRALIEEVRAPVSEEQAAGENVTYDDLFMQVKTEVEEDGVLSGRIDQEKALAGEGSMFVEGDGTDYEAVVAGSREILRDRSKDVRAASYLTLGLFHRRGAEGLAEGLAALNTLVRTHWNDLFPPKQRMRGRRSAFAFLAQRLKEALTSYEPDADERASLEQSLETLDGLQAFLLDKMEDKAPVLSSLKRALENALKQAPEPETTTDSDAADAADAAEETSDAPEGGDETSPAAGAPESPDGSQSSEDSTSAPASSSGTAPSERSGAGAGTTAGGASGASGSPPGSRPQAQRKAREAIEYFHEADLTDPMPFRLARALRWGALRREPPHEQGATRLEEPPAPRRSYLRNLSSQGEHQQLVAKAEASFLQSPYHLWFDLQRLLVRSLEALGAPYGAVREAVLLEAAFLTERLPGLLDLNFRDGTPFAEAQTKRWIDRQVRPVLHSRNERASGEELSEEASTPAEERSVLEEQYAEARAALDAGHLDEAVKLLQQGARRDATGRGRFLYRLRMAELCTRGGRPEVALPLLEGLAEDVERYRLDAWNPPLALEAWSALQDCYTSLTDPSEASEGLQQKKRRVFEKICRLDTRSGLSLEPPLPEDRQSGGPSRNGR